MLLAAVDSDAKIFFLIDEMLRGTNSVDKYLGSKAVIEGRRNIGQVMDAIGLKAAADIKKKISNIWEPPLSPYTIKQRLSKKSNQRVIGNLTKPLIDTGIMLNTLTNTTETE